MNLAQKTLIFVVGVLLAGAAVRGDVPRLKDHPYKGIPGLNPFRLKDPPPLTKEPATNVFKLDVRVSGITSVSGTRRAWLVVLPGPGSPPKHLNNLSEGDQIGLLQVVEINQKEETVKILNAGIPVTLNFKEHGLPSLAASAAPLPVTREVSSIVPRYRHLPPP